MVRLYSPVPLEARETRVLVTTALLTAVLLVALERGIAMVFVLNFSTDGPNVTALLSLFLLTGFLYPLGLARWWPPSRRARERLLWLAILLFGVSTMAQPAVAALAALFVHAAALPVLVGLIQSLDARAAPATALGVAVNLALRGVLDSASPYATTWGLLLLGLLALATLAVGTWTLRTGPDALQADRRVAPWAAYVFLQYAFLGSATVLARWADRDPLLMLGAGLLGLLLGAMLALQAAPRGPAVDAAWTILLGVTLADLLWWNLAAAPSVFLAHVAALQLLRRGLGSTTRAPLARIGLGLGATQALALLLLFLEISAGNWAFMPDPLGGLTRGNAALFWLLLGLLLPIVAATPRPGRIAA